MIPRRQPFKNAERRLIGCTPPTTTAADSIRLARVRQTGTRPELAVRVAARRLGLQYRLHNADLPGSPDIANRSRKFSIFVHGCFWHRHSNCAGASTPKSNRSFWEAKFQRNQERDARAVRALEAQGFHVLVIWECETRNEQLLDRLLGALVARLRPPQ
jgi:DNA mismatch endonuclease, patch repair protein